LDLTVNGVFTNQIDGGSFILVFFNFKVFKLANGLKKSANNIPVFFSLLFFNYFVLTFVNYLGTN